MFYSVEKTTRIRENDVNRKQILLVLTACVNDLLGKSSKGVKGFIKNYYILQLHLSENIFHIPLKLVTSRLLIVYFSVGMILKLHLIFSEFPL